MKIYYTSDVHGYFYPSDYLDREFKETGLLCAANNYKKDKNTLIIDGGDILQGSAFDYYLQNKKDSKTIAEIMSMIDVDYFTIGNHDFNYGYDYLKEYITNHSGKCICANVFDKTGEIPIYDHEILEIENKTIGIIGVVTDWVNLWEKKENLINFEIKDTFSSAKSAYEKIKDTDYKICIYHGGFEIDLDTLEKNSDTDENVGAKIAKELDLDLLLTGHQHMTVPSKELFGTHTLQPPANAVQYMQVDIDFENKKTTSTLCDVSPDVREDIYEKFLDIENDVQDYLDIPIAKLEKDYHPSGKLDMALNGSELADFINSIQLDVSGADISITSFANEIKGFNKIITIRDVLTTYRFPNTLVVLEIDGKSLRDALEQNYSYIVYENNNFKINDAFLNPKVEHYNFDFFSNIDFILDLKKDIGNRIGKIEFNGKTINDNDKFSIVMNNYRSTGAGNFPMYKNLKVVKEINMEVSEILIDYFKNNY